MSNPLLYTTQDKKVKVELYELGESVFLAQDAMAKLFDTSKQNISLHIRNILQEGELQEDSVVKEYLTTANDGKSYKVKFYSLEMILAVGFRVRSKRGVQFRVWANEHLRSYLQKGFIIDSDRLKNPNGRSDYFDELLEQIRDIRASEKRFYQKVRELFALSADYDPSDKATQMFFAQTQNKLLYAITHKTAAELICERANAKELNMGLTSWKGNIVRKGDVIVAKNYLHKEELDSLNRLVNVFLESAEIRVRDKQTLTMDFWRQNVDSLLVFQGKEILKDNGSVSNAQMEQVAYEQYEKFNQKRKEENLLKAEKEDEEILESTYKALRKGKANEKTKSTRVSLKNKATLEKKLILKEILAPKIQNFESLFASLEFGSFSHTISLQEYQIAALKSAITALSLYTQSPDSLYHNYLECELEDITKEQINTASFWMATGSGKSIVMIKLIALLHDLFGIKSLPAKPIMLLTPNDKILE